MLNTHIQLWPSLSPKSRPPSSKFHLPSSKKILLNKRKKNVMIYIVTVCIPRPRFHLHVFCCFFFFFGPHLLTLGNRFYCCEQCMHCSHTVHVLKNIKNESHDTIYTFKNYFATVFSVSNFQFSATISSIQTDP